MACPLWFGLCGTVIHSGLSGRVFQVFGAVPAENAMPYPQPGGGPGAALCTASGAGFFVGVSAHRGRRGPIIVCCWGWA